ncbi:hypothetical protein M0802_013633 [Mischocyttarus mexicanus]|nr:hypothetical protein M0802_013633 [Mischocyttarus mexicanus]
METILVPFWSNFASILLLFWDYFGDQNKPRNQNGPEDQNGPPSQEVEILNALNSDLGELCGSSGWLVMVMMMMVVGCGGGGTIDGSGGGAVGDGYLEQTQLGSLGTPCTVTL